MPAVRSVAEIKTQLWQELALKAELINEGVAITQQALDLIQPGVIAQEQVHSLFEMDFDTHDFELPSGYDLPNGLSVGFRWNKRSGNVITADGDAKPLINPGLPLAPAEQSPGGTTAVTASTFGQPPIQPLPEPDI